MLRRGCARLGPFDEVQHRAAGLAAEGQGHEAAVAVVRQAERRPEAHCPEAAHYAERRARLGRREGAKADQLVEGDRAIEVAAVDVEVHDPDRVVVTGGRRGNGCHGQVLRRGVQACGLKAAVSK
jgi:hypothetical protein